MDTGKILVVDDNPEIREVLDILLRGEGYGVVLAARGEEALLALEAHGDLDLVILDVMMPGEDGMEVCGRIRERSNVPILFLTARSGEQDKAKGFLAGGDDYLSKPFATGELLPRVKALVRRFRIYQGKKQAENGDVILFRDLEVHKRCNRVKKAGEDVALTELEYQILLLMASNVGRVYSAQELYEQVWKEPYFHNSAGTVMVHIRKLRTKIEEDAKRPEYILTVWGRGYKMEY